MTTFSHFTDKHLIVGGSNDQYTNINLNQNQKFGNDSFSKHKKTDLLNEKSKEFANNTYSTTQKKFHSWKKSTKDLTSILFAVENEDGLKKRKNTKTNSSTLSLHISTYNKSFEASALGVGKVVKRREMEKKNPFEFPRQQESNPGPSEISQFRSSQQLQNPNANNRNSMPQYSVQQQQHLPPIATFQYNQGHGVYPNPSFQDPLSDVLRRLAEMDARMSAYDQKIEELEQQNRVQSTRISELNALLTHSRPQDITFVFDPQNIRDRASFDFDAKFNNGNDERINLWDTASTLSAWRRSANDSLPGEIFRGVVKQIYNEELSYYTASKGQRQGLTSLYSLKEKIKDLVIAGYVNAETSDTEKAVIEAWVNENMEKQLSSASVAAKAAIAVNKGKVTLENALDLLRREQQTLHVPHYDQDPIENNTDIDMEEGHGEEIDDEPVYHETADLTEYEFTMAMLGKFIFSNMSVSKVKKEVAFDNLLERKTITSQEYLNFLKDIDKRYTVTLQYICCNCERVFFHMPKRCTCGLNFKRGKGASLVSVATCSIKQQIIDIVQQNFDAITKIRQLTEKRSQLNEFPKSLPEFRDDGRVIKLMINTDGVSPKQSYRGDMWPGYLAIADLDTEARGAVSNAIIAFLICGVGTPTQAMWKLALDPIKSELHELKSQGFIIKNTKFYIELEHGIFDNAASVHLYEGIGYNAIGKGCLNCVCESSKSKLLTSKGQRSRRVIWPIEGAFECRSDETILNDAENGVNGFKGGITPWMDIILPNRWRLDALHVLEEGIIPRLLDPYFPKREWAQMNRVYFVDSLFPSRSKLHPRSILEYNKYNGGDKRCLYFTFFPFLLQYEAEEKPVDTSIQFLLWHLIRLLASTLLTAKTIDDICEVLPTIAKYLDNLFPDELRQMKSHRFFLHLKDELLSFGTPYDFSTAFFEMLNRIIKVGFNAFDTTSLPLRALTMMLARKDWIAQVINRENKSKKFNKIVDTICPSFTIRKIVYAKDDLVLYRLHGEICYGKILSSQNSMFNIQQIKGISLLHYGTDDSDLPGDIRYAFFLFNQHPPFGIKVTAYATSATVLKQDIICHCCMFSDNFHSYIFSLDFRLSGK